MINQRTGKSRPSFSSIWLMIMNVLYFILGLAMIGMSSWGVATHKTNEFTKVIPASALNTLIATGVFLVLLSIAGCLGVKFNSKVGGRYILGFYALFMVIVMIMEFSAAVALFVFVGKFDIPGSSYKDEAIKKLVQETYSSCCKEGHPIDPSESFCWLPASTNYPCDSEERFRVTMFNYIEDRLQPVAAIALFLCLLQLFTAIMACCNQCSGKNIQKQREANGPFNYEDSYENDEAYSTGATPQYSNYSAYINTGQVPRHAAPQVGGAAAPRVPTRGGPVRGPTRK